jgi:hypothetical protein
MEYMGNIIYLILAIIIWAVISNLDKQNQELKDSE